MSACVTYITRIARVTLKTKNNTLLIYKLSTKKCQQKKIGSQAAPAVRWSSCELRVMAKIQKFVWEYLGPLLGSKKRVKFSIKTPRLTSTVHRLLSDRRLLCWKVATLASYSFLGLLLLREGVNQEMDNSLKRPRRSKGSGHKTSNTSW